MQHWHRIALSYITPQFSSENVMLLLCFTSIISFSFFSKVTHTGECWVIFVIIPTFFLLSGLDFVTLRSCWPCRAFAMIMAVSFAFKTPRKIWNILSHSFFCSVNLNFFRNRRWWICTCLFLSFFFLSLLWLF